MANVLTFITAGHEATSVALAWALWLVAKDETVQQRVYDEVLSVAGSVMIGATHVEGLAFTRQVIQEAMRLFPPAPSLGRQPKLDMQLGEMAITPRTQITIPVFALHRHRQLWQDPNAFDPDRFAPEQINYAPAFPICHSVGVRAFVSVRRSR